MWLTAALGRDELTRQAKNHSMTAVNPRQHSVLF